MFLFSTQCHSNIESPYLLLCCPVMPLCLTCIQRCSVFGGQLRQCARQRYYARSCKAHIGTEDSRWMCLLFWIITDSTQEIMVLSCSGQGLFGPSPSALAERLPFCRDGCVQQGFLGVSCLTERINSLTDAIHQLSDLLMFADGTCHPSLRPVGIFFKQSAVVLLRFVDCGCMPGMMMSRP
jgi:hypothetical protein